MKSLKIEKETILNKLHNIDARMILEKIPPGVNVQTTITSPPYFDMKDYGSNGQIGYGQNYDDYIADVKAIFKKILKITVDNGTLWIIIDTFKRNNQVVSLPFDLANKLKEVGWLLQDIIIWKKDRTVPWSSNGFIQRKFEYILFFSKSSNFKSNKDRVRIYDTSQLKKWWVKYPERYNPKGKALDEIWEFPIPIQGSWGEEYIRHFCPLPKELVATIIQLSTDENDIILDPFAGSGTVLSQSAYMKRNFIGFELNDDYVKMFDSYLKKTFEINRNEYETLEQLSNQNEFESQILNLRALKFGRILLNNIEKELNRNDLKIFVSINGKSTQKYKSIVVNYQILIPESKNELFELITNIITNPPLSKFGIEAKISLVENKKFNAKIHYGYSRSNSYSYMKNINLDSKKVKVISDIKVELNENNYI